MNEHPSVQQYVIGFIERYVDDLRRLVIHPYNFFKAQRGASGFLEPTLFAAASILIPALFYALWLAPFTLGLSLIFVIPGVFYGICTLLISTIVLYGIVRCCGGEGDFESVYRSVAYSGAAFYLWLIPIPFVNLLLFAAAFCALLYLSLREMQGLTPRKAALILLFPAFLILPQGVILSYAAFWLVFRGFFHLLHYFGA